MGSGMWLGCISGIGNSLEPGNIMCLKRSSGTGNSAEAGNIMCLKCSSGTGNSAEPGSIKCLKRSSGTGIERKQRMKAVVFDMDGVLFDTERLCMKAWMAVAEQNGLPGMEEIFPQCIGLNANDSRRIVLEAYGEDFDYPHFREQTSLWFKEYIANNGLPIKPGVREILGWLKTTSYAVGLASSTRKETVSGHLGMAGIGDSFDVLVTGDMVEHSKPRPDIYLRACRELGVEPEQAYAIEDSPNGIRSAYAAGMRPLLVPDMIIPDEEIRQMSAAEFKDLNEVLAYLRGGVCVKTPCDGTV